MVGNGGDVVIALWGVWRRCVWSMGWISILFALDLKSMFRCGRSSQVCTSHGVGMRCMFPSIGSGGGHLRAFQQPELVE